MDTPKMITIQEAWRSKNGQWLWIKDQDQVKYLSKCWDLEMMVGGTVMAQTSVQNTDTGQLHYLNDYQLTERTAHPVNVQPPPVQAPAPIQTPVQHPQATIPPQPQQVDRDASIVAQTLCKTVTFSSPRAAWQAYIDFYALYTQTPWMNVSPPADPAEGPWLGEAEAAANETAQQQGFSDEIPF